MGKTGELLFTTGYAIKDDHNALNRLIPLLNEKAGWFRYKPKRYLTGYTEQMIILQKH